MRDLGTLGGTKSEAYAVNDRREVVGWSLDADGHLWAFIWTEDRGMRRLGSIAAGFSEAHDINNRGQVVGRFYDFGPRPVRSFIWTEETGYRLIPSFGGGDGCANAINDKGDVVGWAFSGRHPLAYLWSERDGLIRLRPPTGMTDSYALGVNNRREVVGRALYYPGGLSQGIHWRVETTESERPRQLRAGWQRRLPFRDFCHILLTFLRKMG